MTPETRIAAFWLWLTLGVALSFYAVFTVGCEHEHYAWVDENQGQHEGTHDNPNAATLPVLILGFGTTGAIAFLFAPKEWKS